MAHRLRSFARALTVSALTLTALSSALAGPPLICWKVETGGAASLPWVDNPRSYQGMDEAYPISRLGKDTLGLLRADTPVLARMETLRRAALYASENSKAEGDLIRGLVERAKQYPSDALAWFDVGYLMEARRQANGKNEPAFWSRLLETLHVRSAEIEGLGKLTGYDCIVKALELGKADPEMEYAAALVTWYPRRSTHEQHLARAAAGAVEGSFLEANLLKHFGDRGRTLQELRASVSAGPR